MDIVIVMQGLKYILRGRLYLSLTNVSNTAGPLTLRGPSFRMPSESGFAPLPEGVVPSADNLFQAVDEAFDSGVVAVADMESEDITFAGAGEPLLQLETLTRAAEMIKERRHGASLRVKSNGLVTSSDCPEVAQLLKDAGISKISIALTSENPQQYQQIMKPSFPIRASLRSVEEYESSGAGGAGGAGCGFGDVCAMVIACAEAGLEVTCTAVERPGVNLAAVRALSQALGAADFQSASYHA